MDVREKLIDLIIDAKRTDPETGSFTEYLADCLINNGVTVQERGQWIYDFNLAGSNFYRCSVCDRQETLLEKEDIYEYCPFCHCGSNMIPQQQKGE